MTTWATSPATSPSSGSRRPEPTPTRASFVSGLRSVPTYDEAGLGWQPTATGRRAYGKFPNVGCEYTMSMKTGKFVIINKGKAIVGKAIGPADLLAEARPTRRPPARARARSPRSSRPRSRGTAVARHHAEGAWPRCSTPRRCPGETQRSVHHRLRRPLVAAPRLRTPTSHITTAAPRRPALPEPAICGPTDDPVGPLAARQICRSATRLDIWDSEQNVSTGTSLRSRGLASRP